MRDEQHGYALFGDRLFQERDDFGLDGDVEGGGRLVGNEKAVTGKKRAEKMYYRHSGYPGGLKERTLDEMLERRPEEVIRKAVKGMLPKNRLARKQLTKLKVYAGADHPHAAQQPKVLEINT